MQVLLGKVSEERKGMSQCEYLENEVYGSEEEKVAKFETYGIRSQHRIE